ncbi:hypothetical protein OSTOST_00705 [Ostertagia ostertagi]
MTVLLDSGSQHSFIKEGTAQNLGFDLETPQDITTITFGGHSHTEKSYRVKVVLRNKINGRPITLCLWTRKSVTTVSLDTSEDGECSNTGNGKSTEVDVLIGMDYYWEIVEFNSNCQLPSGLVQSNTRLVPVLLGYQSSPLSRVHSTSDRDSAEEHQSSSVETDQIVQQLFGLESVGTKEDIDDSDASIIQHFYDTVKVENGLIYPVPLEI